MVGTVISKAGVSVSTAGVDAITTVNGRLMALDGPITLVNTVIRPTCAGVTPLAPYTRARTAPPVSAPKPVALPSAEPAVAPTHNAACGTRAAI